MSPGGAKPTFPDSPSPSRQISPRLRSLNRGVAGEHQGTRTLEITAASVFVATILSG